MEERNEHTVTPLRKEKDTERLIFFNILLYLYIMYFDTCAPSTTKKVMRALVSSFSALHIILYISFK